MDENNTYGYVELLFSLNNNVSVKTTTAVVGRYDVIDHHISRFLSPTSDSENKTKVFGFDTEWNIEHDRDSSSYKCTDVAVQLCDGDSCLIILLSDQFSAVPPSLVNFLRLPNYTFVGFGIKDNVAKLEKNFGFGCRNAIELGPLAASVMKKPRLSYCGVDELLFIVNQLDFRKDRPLRIGFKWDRYGGFSKELAKLTTINVYSYQMIGAKLLAQDWCQ